MRTRFGEKSSLSILSEVDNIFPELQRPVARQQRNSRRSEGVPDHILITNAAVAVVISYQGIRADSCIGAGGRHNPSVVVRARHLPVPAHNPEVAGSNPAPATPKALVRGPLEFQRLTKAEKGLGHHQITIPNRVVSERRTISTPGCFVAAVQAGKARREKDGLRPPAVLGEPNLARIKPRRAESRESPLGSLLP
jgi:hypothetical protein